MAVTHTRKNWALAHSWSPFRAVLYTTICFKIGMPPVYLITDFSKLERIQSKFSSHITPDF